MIKVRTSGSSSTRWRMWLLPAGRLRRADQQYAEVRSLSDARLTAAMERQADRQEPRRRGDTIEALLLAEPPVLGCPPKRVWPRVGQPVCKADDGGRITLC